MNTSRWFIILFEISDDRSKSNSRSNSRDSSINRDREINHKPLNYDDSKKAMRKIYDDLYTSGNYQASFNF